MPAVDAFTGRFVDTSVRVDSLAGALRFWVEIMGFSQTAHSDGTSDNWATVEDPRTGQRLCLTEGEAAPFAVSIETTDLDTTVQTLTDAGCQVVEQGANETNGFRWALCTDPSGIPLLVGCP
jgi:predicted enzyme related to lactoylglutathione lyase